MCNKNSLCRCVNRFVVWWLLRFLESTSVSVVYSFRPTPPQKRFYRKCLSPIRVTQTTTVLGRIPTNDEENVYQNRFPDDVVSALDLVPVIDMVASYCGTYRGQQALYEVVGQDDTTKRARTFEKNNGRLSGQFISRKRQLYDAVIPTYSGNDAEVHDEQLLVHANSGVSATYTTDQSMHRVDISPIASSVQEVSDMYRLVVEATCYLDGGTTTTTNRTFPPIYPMDATNGPFDLTHRKGSSVSSDDDDFLQFTTAKDDRWTLEHVIQADQVIAKLISLYDWSIRLTPNNLDNNQEGIFSIQSLVIGNSATNCDGIDINRLTKVWSIIHDTVEIIRVRTLTDAWGQTTYQFRFRNQKFPILSILRDRCERLQEEIVNSKGTSSKRREQELYDMEQELIRKESEIKVGLIQAIHSIRSVIDHGLDTLAKIDVIFAKAAFGVSMGAEVASMDVNFLTNNRNGCVRVEKFIHPLLGRRNDASVVPIDLVLGEDYQTLIISGSNGGGKSVAMKSFGLISVLAKLGIPIVAESVMSIQYFDEVLVSIGDYQDVERGESTYISQLMRQSSLIDRVGTNKEKSYLVLLDELGTGTEEAPGGAIGQAIVEKLMETKSCFVVATTHSPIVKAWSFNSATIGSAAVLLQSSVGGNNDHWNRRPSYQLQYGCIGESYALGAASRCLSEDIVARASAILVNNQDESNPEFTSHLAYNIAITKSLEKQLDLATERALEADEIFHDTAMIQYAMVSLANAYDRHLSRLEQRIELCYQVQRKVEDNDDAEVTEHVLGETLADLRIVRTIVKNERDILRERGLKRLRDDDEISTNQSVVVVDSSSPWNGNTGTITTREKLPDAKQELLSAMDVVVVFTDTTWNEIQLGTINVADDFSLMLQTEPLVFKRYQLAIWDYSNFWDNDKSLSDDKYASIADSNRRLRSLLAKLPSDSTQAKRNVPVSSSATKSSSQFSSSRERKSAKRKSKNK